MAEEEKAGELLPKSNPVARDAFTEKVDVLLMVTDRSQLKSKRARWCISRAAAAPIRFYLLAVPRSSASANVHVYIRAFIIINCGTQNELVNNDDFALRLIAVR